MAGFYTRGIRRTISNVSRVAKRRRAIGNSVVSPPKGAFLAGAYAVAQVTNCRSPKHFGARMGVLQALLDRRFWQQGELHTG